MNSLTSAGGLPVNYEFAKKALAACERVDECKEWGDRAAAIASYARQKRDRTLLDLASRIRARAVRRIGELLEHHASRHGKSATTKMAEQSGVSKSESLKSRQVARVPRRLFEDVIERNPPMPVGRIARLCVRPTSGDRSALIWKLLDRMSSIIAEFPERSVVESIAAADSKEELAIKKTIGKAVDYFDALALAADKRL